MHYLFFYKSEGTLNSIQHHKMNYETNLAMTFNNYALFSQEVFVLFLTLIT